MTRRKPRLISQGVYNSCLQSTFENLEIHFATASRILTNAKIGTYSFPSDQTPIEITANRQKMWLTKDPDDQFDLVYWLSFKMPESKFATYLEKCLRTCKIKFKFKDYEYKMDLLEDFLDLVALKYKLKTKVLIENNTIIYNIMVIRFTKSETYVEDIIIK